MGGRTITWTGLITPDEVKEIARTFFTDPGNHFPDLGDYILYISESAMQNLLDDPAVRNTFIWMDPKSLGDGYVTLYGLRITFYTEPNDN